ncbi:hypothetical protein DITRI_Ditri15bG0102100 [Diplodiscus trichospermus]
MSHQQRRILTPGISKKRKEREAFYSFKPSVPVRSSVYTDPKSPPSPNCPNRLLAGYMAHEFLTRGTLFGQTIDPDQAEAIPFSEPKKPVKQEIEPNLKKEGQSYAEVASILKDGGAHIPGVVNPTQLARWIQM